MHFRTKYKASGRFIFDDCICGNRPRDVHRKQMEMRRLSCAQGQCLFQEDDRRGGGIILPKIRYISPQKLLELHNINYMWSDYHYLLLRHTNPIENVQYPRDKKSELNPKLRPMSRSRPFDGLPFPLCGTIIPVESTRETIVKYVWHVQVVRQVQSYGSVSGVTETQVAQESGDRVQAHDKHHCGVKDSTRAGVEEPLRVTHRVLDWQNLWTKQYKIQIIVVSPGSTVRGSKSFSVFTTSFGVKWKRSKYFRISYLNIIIFF